MINGEDPWSILCITGMSLDCTIPYGKVPGIRYVFEEDP